MPKKGQLRIIHGSTSGDLALKICKALDTDVCSATVSSFANGEINVKVNESIRGDDVFIVHSTCTTVDCNVNKSVMELLLLIHTLKLASARRITAVIPHYGYARQDRKTESRVPISASAVARMITEVGVDGIVTVDLHCGQIQGFFHGYPMADILPSESFANHGRQTHKADLDNLVVVAPDAGAVNRARKLADKIGANRVVTILKRRVEAGKIDTMQLVGSVQGAKCIICDDMIDTAGTLCTAATELTKHGAIAVHAYATHGILTDPAAQRINDCESLVEVVVSDSMPQAENLKKIPKKLKVLSLDTLLADVIRRIHKEESVEHHGAKGGISPAVTPSVTAAMPITGRMAESVLSQEGNSGASPSDMEQIDLPVSRTQDEEAWSLPK